MTLIMHPDVFVRLTIACPAMFTAEQHKSAHRIIVRSMQYGLCALHGVKAPSFEEEPEELCKYCFAPPLAGGVLCAGCTEIVEASRG